MRQRQVRCQRPLDRNHSHSHIFSQISSTQLYLLSAMCTQHCADAGKVCEDVGPMFETDGTWIYQCADSRPPPSPPMSYGALHAGSIWLVMTLQNAYACRNGPTCHFPPAALQECDTTITLNPPPSPPRPPPPPREWPVCSLSCALAVFFLTTTVFVAEAF